MSWYSFPNLFVFCKPMRQMVCLKDSFWEKVSSFQDYFSKPASLAWRSHNFCEMEVGIHVDLGVITIHFIFYWTRLSWQKSHGSHFKSQQLYVLCIMSSLHLLDRIFTYVYLSFIHKFYNLKSDLRVCLHVH